MQYVGPQRIERGSIPYLGRVGTVKLPILVRLVHTRHFILVSVATIPIKFPCSSDVQSRSVSINNLNLSNARLEYISDVLDATSCQCCNTETSILLSCATLKYLLSVQVHFIGGWLAAGIETRFARSTKKESSTDHHSSESRRFFLCRF